MPKSSKEALDWLLAGNERYAAEQQEYPNQSITARLTLATRQNPFATILSCSDSRVPSEIIFDQGLGDLFIVRTAGHVVNGLVLASIEFAVYALNVPLIVVLGHQHCGAVTAVLKDQPLPGYLPELVDYLRPAVQNATPGSHDAAEEAVRANSRYTAAQIASSSRVLADAVDEGRLQIVPAYYHLETGRVTVLD